MPSSDGAEGAPHPFPTIEEFVDGLKARHPKKNFDGMVKFCDEGEYEHINELAHLEVQTLVEKMSLSDAAARLVHEKIARHVAKVKAQKALAHAYH
jgi:hypothetical protein